MPTDHARARLRRAAATAAVLPLVLLAAACGTEAGADAGPDAGPDAGTDPGEAATSPSSPTTSSAAPTEASPNEPTDQTTDQPAAAVRVPADFPLADGLPDRNGDGTPVEVSAKAPFDDFELCGETAWSTTGEHPVADAAGAAYAGEAEDFRSRTLALYPDADAAAAALDTLVTALEECDDAEVGGTVQAYDEVDIPLPEGVEDGATIQHRFAGEQGGFDVGLEVLELFRVGNALYLASYYGEANGSPRTVRGYLDFVTESSAPVVRAMRAFTEA
ncbi:hypothetical protein GCM10023340_21090 [Nocardioides marinquilinus]|uniref:Sensor domain-containing protein n=1 Tax=Nocardioides marinquilinus TaxID=1210400 RepID=A0ABP9PM19_9ACTN